MAFQQSTVFRPLQRATTQSNDSSTSNHAEPARYVEQSQEWVLFAPSQAESSTDRTRTNRTAGLSRISDLGSLNSIARSGQPQSSELDDEVTEDGDLDSLDDGLHAFREPITYQTLANRMDVPMLPTHDGLGTFPASSPLVLEQLWQHEQHNPKRKREGLHRRPSSVQRKFEMVEEFEAQASEEKRIRIEKWRLDQSHAFLEEVERERRQHMKKQSLQHDQMANDNEILGTTPRQSDFLSSETEDEDLNEPLWRRITRKFIRDVIGIDDPLLSVILGESLPGDATPRPSSPMDNNFLEDSSLDHIHQDTWRNRLLQRIARELGVLVHQLSPHPGAFSTANERIAPPDYAGIPIKQSSVVEAEIPIPIVETPEPAFASNLTPNFPPTLRDPAHAENWGFEDEPMPSSSSGTLNLRQEREYWERELDVKMVFRYLANRFIGSSQRDEPPPPSNQSQHDSSASRVAIIRQHHPLVARAHKSTTRNRRESRVHKRPTSSCASESIKSGHRGNALRSGSSRNYWDIGGSAGSGSLMASGGLLGTWGEA